MDSVVWDWAGIYWLASGMILFLRSPSLPNDYKKLFWAMVLGGVLLPIMVMTRRF